MLIAKHSYKKPVGPVTAIQTMSNVNRGRAAEFPRNADLNAGDVIRTGPNATPVFTVVAVHGDQAWVRDEHGNSDYIVPKARCSRVS